MWIDKEHSTSAKGQESGGPKINVGRGRLRRKWIGRASSGKRIGHKSRGGGNAAGTTGTDAIGTISEYRAGKAKEWRLPVILQIVLALEHVIEHSYSTADTRLPIRRPGKTCARSPIVFIGKICSFGGMRIAREQQSWRRVGKPCRLRARQQAKGAPPSIILGRAVLIANSHGEHQVVTSVPFVLYETKCRFLADVGRCAAELEVIFRQAQQEVGVLIQRSIEAVKIELSIHKEIKYCVVLIRDVASPELQIVLSPVPGERI